MFDHVEAGRVLEQPAREDLVPGQRLVDRCAFLDEYLHEGAGFHRSLPRKRAFAGRQLDQHIAHAFGLANLDDKILGLVVALVEQAQRGDAVLYRGAIFAFDHLPGHFGPGQIPGHFGGIRIGIAPAATGGQPGKRGQQEGAAAHLNQPSGVQAS